MQYVASLHSIQSLQFSIPDKLNNNNRFNVYTFHRFLSKSKCSRTQSLLQAELQCPMNHYEKKTNAGRPAKNPRHFKNTVPQFIERKNSIVTSLKGRIWSSRLKELKWNQKLVVFRQFLKQSKCALGSQEALSGTVELICGYPYSPL